MAHNRRGLSLIELLVVIAIIGVLSGLMLGTLNWVREAARTVACAGNLRQLGIACEVFASDRRGVYPPAQLRSNMSGWLGGNLAHITRYTGHSPYGDTWNTWNSYLTPYLEKGDAKDAWGNDQALFKIFQCPSHPRQVRQDVAGTFGPSWHLYSNAETGAHYGINTAYLDANTCPTTYNAGSTAYPAGRPGWPGFGLGQAGVHDNSRFKSRIANASRTIQLAEHYGQESMAQINRAIWTEPPFARLPVDRHGNALPVPATAGSFAAGFPLADAFKRHALLVAHRGRSNYLFVDGRVQTLAPWETCSADPSAPNLWTGR